MIRIDPSRRVTRLFYVVALAVLAVAVAGDVRGGANDNWAHALYAAALVLLSALSFYEVRYGTKKVTEVVNVPLWLFVAFSVAADDKKGVTPPAWLTALSIGILVLLVAAIPFAAYTISKSRDERERKIILNAIAVSFIVTMLMLVTFYLLDEYTSVTVPTAKWVLLGMALSAFGSFALFRERM